MPYYPAYSSSSQISADFSHHFPADSSLKPLRARVKDCCCLNKPDIIALAAVPDCFFLKPGGGFSFLLFPVRALVKSFSLPRGIGTAAVFKKESG